MENKAKSKDKKMTPREMINKKSKERRDGKKNKSSSESSIPSCKVIPSYEEVSKRFFEPYPIPELGGRKGLTCTDIAKLLDVKVSHVIQKVKSKSMEEMFKYLESLKAEISAHPAAGFYTDYALDAKTAETFIAKYNNPIGWMYIRYLQACREVLSHAIKQIEITIKENEELKKENDGLRGRLPKKAKSGDERVVSVVLGTNSRKHFLGGQVEFAETFKARQGDLPAELKDLKSVQVSTGQAFGVVKRILKIAAKIPDCTLLQKTEKLHAAIEEFNEYVNKTSLPKINVNSTPPEIRELCEGYLEIPLLEE